MNRRSILRSSLVLGAPTIVPASVLGKDKPSDRIAIGVIGLGGMGMGNLNGFLRAEGSQVVAVCDVHQKHHRDKTPGKGKAMGLVPAKDLVESRYAKTKPNGTYKGCQAYADFRELCARDDIDAVVVATPDHWHALCTLEALRNGKDVYCEKPVTHLFAEGQMVYREAAKQKAIFQTGSQQRSDIRFRIAAEAVLNRVFGKLEKVEVGLPSGPSKPKHPDIEPAKVPDGLDYDFWCGPSEKLPYIPARHHRNWRWHLAYGGGNLMDWIGHHNDIAHWGMGMDDGGPESVEAVGWTFPETPIYNGPVHYELKCVYPGGVELSISNKNKGGTKWIGENGWIWVNRGRIDASNKDWIREKTDRGPIKAYVSTSHRKNFLDGIRTRKACIAPAETAHRSITSAHLGFVSHALGRRLTWDAKNESIVGDAAADALLKKINYRKPWRLG